MFKALNVSAKKAHDSQPLTDIVFYYYYTITKNCLWINPSEKIDNTL